PSLSLHEADLSKHLSNPTDDNSAKKKEEDALKAAAAAAAAKEKLNEKKFAENKGPIEPASAEDFQFMQAMNVLKGLPVQKAPDPVKLSETKK
ncbi:MAG: peptidase S41, partial [Methylophilales bacterium 16-45-7]